VQKNLSTGVERQVRRGRFTVIASTPADYVEESCALCTERFSETPEWPLRRTPCNHAFHWTCLQHILRQRAGEPRCPMCRQSIASMSAGEPGGRGAGEPMSGLGAGRGEASLFGHGLTQAAAMELAGLPPPTQMGREHARHGWGMGWMDR